MRPLLHQRGDHSAQRQQRLVDVSRLASSLVHGAGTADVLAAGEIDLNRKRLGHFRRCRPRPLPSPLSPDYYQIEFSDLHQLLPFQRDLLHVDGDGEHRVGATVEKQEAGERTEPTWRPATG